MKGRPKDTISSKRGRKRLREHADKFLSDTLELVEILTKKAKETGTPAELYKAIQARQELIPFMFPKLQAVAHGEFDQDGDIVTPQLYSQIVDTIRAVERGEVPPLIEAPDDDGVKE